MNEDIERETSDATIFAKYFYSIVEKILTDEKISANISMGIISEIAAHCQRSTQAAITLQRAVSLSERIGTIMYFFIKLAPIHSARHADKSSGKNAELLSANEQLALSIMVIFIIEAGNKNFIDHDIQLDPQRIKAYLHDLFDYDDGLFYKSLIYDLRYRPITRESLVMLVRSILIGANVSARPQPAA